MSSQKFHHKATTTEAECTCPIHRNRHRDPFTAPLGLSFANDIETRSIDTEEAELIYNAHHSYMDGDLHNANLDHHGIYYQNELMGAITYRYPMISRKRLHFNTDGELLPEPLSDSDYDSLPNDLEHRARDLIPQLTDRDIAEAKVVQGDRIVAADRICLGVRMANLASAGLAASQENFFTSESCPDPVKYLITFVRSDYEGSMVKALRGKGWRCVGWTEPSQASNREYKEIRDHYKWCFVCPIEEIIDQCAITDWL